MKVQCGGLFGSPHSLYDIPPFLSMQSNKKETVIFARPITGIGNRLPRGKSKIYHPKDGEVWKIRDLPHFTTVSATAFYCYYLLKDLSCIDEENF